MSVQVSDKLQSIIKAVKELSVVELVDLVGALKTELGLSDADLAGGGGVVMAAAPTAAAAPAADEAPTSFNVVLLDGGEKKIQVIKVVREISGLGLAEAKKFVETPPQNVKEGLNKDEAEALKKKLEEAGAKVELKGV